MKLDANLKTFLATRKVRASELARLAGVPSSTLHQWLTGGSVRDLEQLRRVCDKISRILGWTVRIDDLLFSDLKWDAPLEAPRLDFKNAKEIRTWLTDVVGDHWLDGKFEIEVRIRRSHVPPRRSGNHR